MRYHATCSQALAPPSATVSAVHEPGSGVPQVSGTWVLAANTSRSWAWRVVIGPLAAGLGRSLCEAAASGRVEVASPLHSVRLPNIDIRLTGSSRTVTVALEPLVVPYQI